MLPVSRHTTRFTMGIAVLLASCAVLSQAVQAKSWLDADESVGKVRGWQIGYSQGFAGCLARASFTDQTTVWFGHSLKKSYFVAVANPNWQTLKSGSIYKLNVTLPKFGKWNGSFIGFNYGGMKGVFLGNLKEAFIEQVAAAPAFRLFAAETRMAGVVLNGSRAALQAVRDCNDAHYERARNDLDRARQQEAKRGGAAPTSAAPPTAPKPKPEPRNSSGTGFAVTRNGHILTNFHVVKGCTSIRVGYSGGVLEKADVLATDSRNDLAVLRTSLKIDVVPTLKSRVRVGDDVYVYGFPLSGLLSKTGNFTVGYITSAAGLGDDTSQVQISAPVQPGNSGGPLVDAYGNVVGVIVSKLNVLRVAQAIKDVPQNVNFAIKSSIAATFLDSNGIEVPSETSAEKLSPADIAARSTKYTVRVLCKRE